MPPPAPLSDPSLPGYCGAASGHPDRARLLSDAGIIRNRLKVDAAIHNANNILDIRDQHGSFASWLDAHHPRSREDWVRLFRTMFRFTGGEITRDSLVSTGYFPSAHHPDGPVYPRVLERSPPWARDDVPGPIPEDGGRTGAS